MYASAEPALDVTVDGSSVVGPVSYDQVRRGISSGQIPMNAFVRVTGTLQWVRLDQFPLGPPSSGHSYPGAAYPGHPNPHSAPQGVAAPLYASPVAPVHAAPPPPPPASAPRVRAGEASELECRIADLRRELESVEESIEIQSFGFYRPKYDFGSAEKYVERLKEVRERQKSAIKDSLATFCDTEWRVSGSAAEGKKMVQRMSKLMLRAFNGECDAAIAKARYDNVAVLEQRVTKSCEEINKLGHSNRICITRPYYELKLAELHLVHEHREQVQREKDEQKRIKEQMREEQRALEEIERAKAEAEKEETHAAKALDKARAELLELQGKQVLAQGQHTEKLEALVGRLENELKQALDRKAKAIARAQLTRSGHVYVLSNLGSFGEGVYKIGMTRRLEPLDRVDELGDASVPFPFDVHAIIYSEDAPALEHALHKRFAHRRLNMVNVRKEFFRVTLDELRDAVEELHGLVTFVLTSEAEEWRKTRSIAQAS